MEDFQETVGREIAARVGKMYLDSIAAEVTIAKLQEQLAEALAEKKPE